MKRSITAVVRVVATMFVAVGLVALPTSAFGQASIERFSDSYMAGPFPMDDTCLGFGVVGTLTGTGTIEGQVVETDTGFHFTGTDTLRVQNRFPRRDLHPRLTAPSAQLQ